MEKNMQEKEPHKEEENAIIHKDNSLHRLDLSFIKHINFKQYKTTHLLAYWINDYANYHDEEKNFDSSKLITFKRGNIIKVNLGFKIGSEFGGLHYCIVLDKKDNPKNKTLTVIPLTSKKENKKYPNNSIDLGNEIYELLNQLYTQKRTELSEKYNDIWNLPADKIKNFTSDFEYIEKIKEEISKMKIGSVALTNQITTISKQRIFNDNILKKVKLSNSSLDLLDKQIIKSFTK